MLKREAPVSSRRGTGRSPALALLALTAMTYLPALFNDFVLYDDDLYVTDNAQVQQGLTPASILYACTTLDCSNWIPVTWLSLELDASLFGLQPWGFHLTNVVLQCANVLLLFFWLSTLTGQRGAAWVVAAVWAVHPLHVESVAWISERKNLLCTLFLLLSLHSWTIWSRSLRPGTYLASLLWFTLGLLSKSMVVTLPGLLLLIDLWPLARLKNSTQAETSPCPPRSAVQIGLEKIPFFVLGAGVSAVTVIAQGSASTMTSLLALPLHIRAGNALRGYGWYVWKTFLPLHLQPIYPHPFEKLDWSLVALTCALMLVFTGYSVALRRNHPWLLWGWLWYVISLLPVIGFIQVGLQAQADRYAYIPQIGLLVAVVWEAAYWLSFLPRGRFLAGSLFTVALLAGMFLTSIQCTVWRNTETLWSYTIQTDPQNWIALYERGNYHLLVRNWPAARDDLRRSHEIWPYRAETLAELASVAQQSGDLPGAIRLLEQAAQMDPGNQGIKAQLELARQSK